MIADALPIAFQPAEAVRAVAAQVGGWLGGTRLTVVVALAALAWVGGGRRAGALVLVTSAAALAVAFGVAGALKLPDRVGVPMLAVLPLLSLATPPIDEKGVPPGSRPGRRLWATIVALVLLSPWQLEPSTLMRSIRQTISRRAHLMQVLSDLQAIDPDGLFVWWGAQRPIGAGSVSPWGGPERPQPDRGGLAAAFSTYTGQAGPLRHRRPLRRDCRREDVYLPLRSARRGPASTCATWRSTTGSLGSCGPSPRSGTESRLQPGGDLPSRRGVPAGALIEHHLDGSFVSYRLAAADIPHRRHGRRRAWPDD